MTKTNVLNNEGSFNGRTKYFVNKKILWAVVKQSLSIPEVHGLNPVIGKNLFILNFCLLSTVYWKDKNKEKDGREWPIFIKKKFCNKI